MNENLQDSRTKPLPGFAKWCAGALLAAFLIAGALYARSLMPAASLLYGLAPWKTPFVVRAYSKVLANPISESDFFIPGKNEPVAVRMLFPRHHPDAPIVVLVHGLAPNGYRDGLLSVLADRLAKIGLRVVIPNIPAEQQRLLHATDLDVIGSAVQWSAVHSGHKVALFGISFGGGLVIRTATMPQYAPYIQVVFSDAGFNDIERLGHYYVGETVRRPDGSPYPETPPGSGPLLMAYQHLDEMVPPSDVPVLHTLILGQELNHSGGPAPANILSPEQNNIYDDLRTAHSAAMKQKYDALLARHAEEMSAMSPYGHLQGLQAPLFLLHGVDDNSIPVGETLWTLNEVPRNVPVHALITPWMTHAVLQGRVSWGTKLQLISYVRDVLHEAFHPEPLIAGK